MEDINQQQHQQHVHHPPPQPLLSQPPPSTATETQTTITRPTTKKEELHTFRQRIQQTYLGPLLVKHAHHQPLYYEDLMQAWERIEQILPTFIKPIATTFSTSLLSSSSSSHTITNDHSHHHTPPPPGNENANEQENEGEWKKTIHEIQTLHESLLQAYEDAAKFYYQSLWVTPPSAGGGVLTASSLENRTDQNNKEPWNRNPIPHSISFFAPLPTDFKTEKMEDYVERCKKFMIASCPHIVWTQTSHVHSQSQQHPQQQSQEQPNTLQQQQQQQEPIKYVWNINDSVLEECFWKPFRIEAQRRYKEGLQCRLEQVRMQKKLQQQQSLPQTSGQVQASTHSHEHVQVQPNATPTPNRSLSHVQTTLPKTTTDAMLFPNTISISISTSETGEKMEEDPSFMRIHAQDMNRTSNLSTGIDSSMVMISHNNTTTPQDDEEEDRETLHLEKEEETIVMIDWEDDVKNKKMDHKDEEVHPMTCTTPLMSNITMEKETNHAQEQDPSTFHSFCPDTVVRIHPKQDEVSSDQRQKDTDPNPLSLVLQKTERVVEGLGSSHKDPILIQEDEDTEVTGGESTNEDEGENETDRQSQEDIDSQDVGDELDDGGVEEGEEEEIDDDDDDDTNEGEEEEDGDEIDGDQGHEGGDLQKEEMEEIDIEIVVPSKNQVDGELTKVRIDAKPEPMEQLQRNWKEGKSEVQPLETDPSNSKIPQAQDRTTIQPQKQEPKRMLRMPTSSTTDSTLKGLKTTSTLPNQVQGKALSSVGNKSGSHDSSGVRTNMQSALSNSRKGVVGSGRGGGGGGIGTKRKSRGGGSISSGGRGSNKVARTNLSSSGPSGTSTSASQQFQPNRSGRGSGGGGGGGGRRRGNR